MMLIFEEYGINTTDEYCALIKRIIEVRLVTFSEKYYDLKSCNQYTNNDYDRYIDETILMVVSMTIKQVYEQLKYSSVPKILYIPNEENYVSGITYISDFMKKNKVEDSKWFAKYDKQIEDMIYDKNCTYILSFDRNIYLFSKENNIFL